MRVLITGCTLRQCEREASERTPYTTVFNALHQALELAGHTVERRAVVPLEDLRGRYDVAVIGLHAFGSLSSAFKFGAVWAGWQLPHLLVAEDWKVKLLISQWGNQTYLWRANLITEGSRMWEDYCKASSRWQDVDKVRVRWSRRIDHVVAPAFEWADAELIRSEFRSPARAHKWDPTPWMPQLCSPQDLWPPSSRPREWVCVSLTDQSSWVDAQGCSWKVHRIFDAGKRPQSGGRTATEFGGYGFIPEPQLVREWYASRAGVLMPCYGRECIVGWWRSRPWLAAHAGAVLAGGPSELGGFGPYHELTAAQVEGLSDRELDRAAELQRRDVMSQVRSRADSSQEAARLLVEAANPPIGEGRA